jgi:hypothetical protein
MSASPQPYSTDAQDRGRGWITFAGVLMMVLATMMKNQLSRWAGVVVLSLNALAQLLMMPAYPFWSLAVVAMDILALYGLIIYGGGSSTSRA